MHLAKLRWRKTTKDVRGHLSRARSATQAWWVVLRLKRVRGVQPEDVAIPVETAPGEIAQVDFGYVGRLYDPRAGVMRKAWVFVMVLGYSRHLFARIAFDQTTETWLRLHVEAFEDPLLQVFGEEPVVLQGEMRPVLLRLGTERDHHHAFRGEEPLRLAPGERA